MPYKNIEKKREAERKRYWKNRDRIRARQNELADPVKKHAQHIKRKYGLTSEKYELMVQSQNNCCAICQRPAKVRRMHVDHDHETGEVRGLLCYGCNASLGHLEKHFDRYAEYLK
jgi:hypothetical protein